MTTALAGNPRNKCGQVARDLLRNINKAVPGVTRKSCVARHPTYQTARAVQQRR